MYLEQILEAVECGVDVFDGVYPCNEWFIPICTSVVWLVHRDCSSQLNVISSEGQKEFIKLCTL